MIWTTSIHGSAAPELRLHSRRKPMLPNPERDLEALTARANDLALVEQALRGNQVAREQIVQRLACVPPMLRELHRRYGARMSPEDLADVQQSTLTALWSKLGDYAGRATLETWAYRFAQHEMLKALERRDRTRRNVRDSESVLEAAVEPCVEESWIESKQLIESVERVGEPASDIIRMRHFDDLSFEEIARMRNEPLNTVKARYYRGLEHLRDVLEPYRRKNQ